VASMQLAKTWKMFCNEYSELIKTRPFSASKVEQKVASSLRRG
jgi:hypothetical protein